tara:strand:- start:612 stop:755 length:144 start_codon:yes stop_codon:yes gene_type:complete
MLNNDQVKLLEVVGKPEVFLNELVCRNDETTCKEDKGSEFKEVCNDE